MRALTFLILFTQVLSAVCFAQDPQDVPVVIEPPSVEERLGPRTFGLEARLTFPEVFGVSAYWRSSDRWQFGVEAARYSIPFFVGSTSIRNLSAVGLWHPYEGAFYLGGTMGQQRIALDLGASILGFNTGLSSSVESFVVRGLVGWQWITESGFSWGFRAGLQAPISHDSTVELSIPGASSADIQRIKNTKEYRELYDSLTTVGSVLGKAWLPVFGLIHLGYYF